ncbi:MAG: LacI family DNA-binding transcriptional regulator [Clostridia bacterium]
MARMSDIAKKTGLNISTVSRALNGSYDISESTRILVQEVANEIGYITREHRILARKTILIIVPELLSQYYSEMIHALRADLGNKGYKVITVVSGYSQTEICMTLNDIRAYEVSGIFLVFSAIDSNELAGIYAKMQNIPTVLLSEMGTTIPLDTIFISQNYIMELAVNHLKELGHHSIGYIGEKLSNQRLRELQDICVHNDMNLLERNIAIGEERFELGGSLRMREMIAKGNLPSAIIACYDQMAIGAIHAAMEAGIKVPRDLSILGIDDIDVDEYLPIPLTSIMTPVSQMCTVAVKLLHDLIEKPREHIVQHVSLQSKLIIRDSTARPKTGI